MLIERLLIAMTMPMPHYILGRKMTFTGSF